MKHFLFLFIVLFFSCSSIRSQSDTDPQPEHGELPNATLEEAGFNRDSIDLLLNLLQTTEHRDFRGLVVIKDQHIILEEYYNTFWRNSILDIRSAGKSITALLLGVAIQEGLIESIDQSIYSFFSDESFQVNEHFKEITLRDVLDMSSGLDADTDDPGTVGFAGNWIALDDWKEFILNVPGTARPGEKWVYADIHALLIGLVIEKVSGISLRDFAMKSLFGPLGISQVYWYTNASNQTGAAGNLYLSTLDFARLGLLVVNKGAWQGIQVMDPSYTNDLINHKRFDLSDYFSFADSYGYMWYKTSRTFGKNHLNYLFASGNGGNHLIVVPDQKMVIALTSSAYGPGYGQGRSYAIMSRIFSALE